MERFQQKSKCDKVFSRTALRFRSNGAKVIMQKKVPTYIVGSLKQIDNILKKKKFIGTLIKG